MQGRWSRGGGQGGQGGLVPPAKYSTYKFEKLKVIKLLVSYLSLSETLFMNVKFRWNLALAWLNKIINLQNLQRRVHRPTFSLRNHHVALLVLCNSTTYAWKPETRVWMRTIFQFCLPPPPTFKLLSRPWYVRGGGEGQGVLYTKQQW